MKITTASRLVWTKSSYSGGNASCVETAAGQIPGVIPIRDSKMPAGPVVTVNDRAWGTFVNGMKAGDLA